MPASTERHETRALLRAHLAAASGYRHLTPRCPVCHRLLRLAMEPLTAPQAPYGQREPVDASGPPPGREAATDALARATGAPTHAAEAPDDATRAGTGHRTAPAGEARRDHPDARPGVESPSTT
ncbi:DUF6274 family protein [Streptomyces sp. NPDC006296]|uniref:DUF6274 family protein n=1 Tax=Streptomyces sp. NPDC006296 TaxID=3156746 RepID=UPI0033BB72A8